MNPVDLILKCYVENSVSTGDALLKLISDLETCWETEFSYSSQIFLLTFLEIKLIEADLVAQKLKNFLGKKKSLYEMIENLNMYCIENSTSLSEQHMEIKRLNDEFDAREAEAKKKYTQELM